MNILNNAYHILGLSIDADDKLIHKRYKELLNLIKIDEVGKYPIDFDQIDYSLIRTDDSIKGSYSELTVVSTKIKHYFFRFDIIDQEDENCFALIKDNDFIGWVELRKKLYLRDSKIHYLKNSIIAILMLHEDENLCWDIELEIDYNDFARNLKIILEDKKYRTQFENTYNLHSDFDLRTDVLYEFKNWLPQFFAEYLFDLSEHIKIADLYISFTKVFWIHAKDLDDNENIQKIQSALQRLMKQLEDLDLDTLKEAEIIDILNKFNTCFDQLKKYWLSESHIYQESIKDIFKNIRDKIISLHNNHDNTKLALILAKKLSKFDLNDLQKNKIKEDLKDLNEIDEAKNEVFNQLQSPILLKDLKISVTLLAELIKKWGKFVVFSEVYSFLVYSQKKAWEIYFIPPWVSYFSAAIWPTLVTMFIWRWSLHGFFWTIEVIFTNLFGWKDVTKEIMSRLN